MNRLRFVSGGRERQFHDEYTDRLTRSVFERQLQIIEGAVVPFRAVGLAILYRGQVALRRLHADARRVGIGNNYAVVSAWRNGVQSHFAKVRMSRELAQFEFQCERSMNRLRLVRRRRLRHRHMQRLENLNRCGAVTALRYGNKITIDLRNQPRCFCLWSRIDLPQ